MARIGRRAQQRRIKEIVLGTLALLVVLLAVAGTSYFMMNRPEDLNIETMCPAEGPIGHYVLLVDKTDPLNFTQEQAFSVIFRELVEKRIPEGYLLSVFVLGENFEQTALPLVELCNPGDGSGKSELTSNVKKLQLQYQAKFIEPMLEVSKSLLSTEPANQSPILEMLQLVSINAFRKHSITGERRLILMSDMLHNTPQYSMYQGNIDYPTFSETDYGSKARLEIPGVEVELHYFMNRPGLQTVRLNRFWEMHFEKASARIIASTPLEG